MAITPGEPAGIGPDLVLFLARGGQVPSRPFVVLADPDLLRERALQLGRAGLGIRETDIREYDPTRSEPEVASSTPGVIRVFPVPLRAPVVPGEASPDNAEYILDTLRAAMDGCLAGRFSGMVTGPVHKGVIAASGVPFTGHTEFLAAYSGTERPVMLLAAPGLRVALATTHLPLSAVPGALTRVGLASVLRTLAEGLKQGFDCHAPRILVCGLNPHAGEGGHLGREEITIIAPVIARLQAEGLNLDGPIPADTAFTPSRLRGVDAVLAMYHDQGLPVLKAMGFGRAVNVTLGLPFVRTSVDHGTALEIAGTGRGNTGSLLAALEMAARWGCGNGSDAGRFI